MVSVCLFIQLLPGLLTYSQDYFNRALCVLASAYVRRLNCEVIHNINFLFRPSVHSAPSDLLIIWKQGIICMAITNMILMFS